MSLKLRTRLTLLLPLLALLCGCSLPAQEAQPAVTRDVVYGVADGQELKLDTYVPATPGPHAAVLLIHGGGWRAGDKASEAGTGIALARLGLVCFAVNYRHAPAYRWPAQILDCARAARWVRANAAKYELDPERVGAMGGSAGGHLSLMLGVIKPEEYQSEDDPNRTLSAKVQCVVTFYGPTDLRGASFSPQATSILADFIGAPPGEAQDKYADASPLTRASQETSPVMFVHGDQDTLVPLQQSQMMKAVLDGMGVDNELIVIKNGGHGFGKADQEEVRAMHQRCLQWLLEHLK
jgi:acetyl esterase/lipase